MTTRRSNRTVAWWRRFRCDERGGSVTLVVLLLIPALLLAAGLVVDGGRQLAVRRDVQGAAAAAARAGVQMSPDELVSRRLDPTLATHRAAAAAGRYPVAVTVDELTVTVTASGEVRFVMLAVAGVSGRTLNATATATVLTGVNEEITP